MTEGALSQIYPLFYTFQDTVMGQGFIADVFIKGRATATRDDSEDSTDWLFSGVEPGGLAAEGETLNESYFAFKLALKEILVELSYRADDFEDFEAQVRRFAGQVNEPEGRDWEEAREAVRRGELASPGPRKRDTENPGQAVVFVKSVNEQNATPELNPNSGADSLETAA